MLLEMAKLIKANRALFNRNLFPHEEMSIRALLVKERILKLIHVWDEEQIKPWSLPKVLLQISNDSQTINEGLKQREEKRIEREQAANLAVQEEQEEQAAQSFTLNWNFPMIDNDEDTIPETELDEVIKSSIEDLVPIPKLDLIDPILLGIDEDDFDEEEGAIDIDILQMEDEILREKLLNVNLLIDKIEALNLTPSIPFVLKYPSSSPIPVVDKGDIIFLNDLLNDDPIPEYERFTFDIELDAPVINNFDELNEDECFDPGGGEIVFSPNVEDDDFFTFFIRTFLPFLTYPEDSPLLLSTGSEDTIFDPGIST
ncbi:hypothetical protein Tco_0003080 [Tanacetum coccineum]